MKAWESEFSSPASMDKAGHKALDICNPGTRGQRKTGGLLGLARKLNIICPIKDTVRETILGEYPISSSGLHMCVQGIYTHRCTLIHMNIYIHTDETSYKI